MLCIDLHIRVSKNIFSYIDMTACQTALKFKIKWMNDTYSTSLSLCSGGVLKSEKLIMLCIYTRNRLLPSVFLHNIFAGDISLR